MRKKKWNIPFDWTSKFVDLLIVIIGITIAFKLNNWNESIKTSQEEKQYVSSFSEENKDNYENLVLALDYSKSIKNEVDTLKEILLAKNYEDVRIKSLVSSMMGMANYSPSTTTMENISASGEFDLIHDVTLRKNLINTYNSFKTTTKLEQILSDYVNEYVTPFFFEKVRFSDFSSITTEFSKDPQFENIVFGYDVLLNQLIKGYQTSLDQLKQLNEQLSKMQKELD
ncbi:hypothetical protein JYB62_07115 [Algoriphagus lutimaris]|uniref:DUF6090 family protein n=1 Tax=Algoriphagus lutimaris TaxID=613197 RepID=UPI00196B4A5E|nr:DUF6090 family protein [Algoriphagus lutimaris]MBN3519769.1 hypothetical protein [Algoriphagus lutimaris]